MPAAGPLVSAATMSWAGLGDLRLSILQKRLFEKKHLVQERPRVRDVGSAQTLLVGTHLAVRDSEGRELGDPGKGGDDVHDANSAGLRVRVRTSAARGTNLEDDSDDVGSGVGDVHGTLHDVVVTIALLVLMALDLFKALSTAGEAPAGTNSFQGGEIVSVRVRIWRAFLPKLQSALAAAPTVAISPKLAISAVKSPAHSAPLFTALPQAFAAKDRYEAIQLMDVMKPATLAAQPTGELFGHSSPS